MLGYEGQKKKICFFSGNISRNGGTERVASLIANGLVNKGYDVSILSFEKGESSFYELDEKINLYSLHMERYKGYFSRKILPFIFLNQSLKQNRIDIIIDIDILLSFYTLPQKVFTNIKVISWEHFNFYDNKVKNRMRARKLAAKFSDAIVVLTKSDLTNYRRNLKKIKNIKQIYNPAICKKDKKADISTKTILSVGRLCYQKNFEALLDVWKLVSHEIKDWKLKIVGSGEEKNNLEYKIQSENIQNVEMIPFTEEVDSYYETSSIYVMTSRYEGFPMVLLEAQTKGLPIISFNCPTGPSEIISEGKNGFLISNGNCEEMSEKLILLMRNVDLRRSMSEDAIKNINNFSLEMILNKWCELIDNI